jgi:hypothetical protein
MRLNQIIVERVVNAFSPDDKQPYADRVWDMLQTAYKDIGGFGSAASVDELVDTPGIWKLAIRGGDITALNIYRDSLGRKSIASATDGSIQGKKDYMMLKSADVKLDRAWAEVSGKPEAILRKLGAGPLPNKFAEILTGKKILDHNSDGYHYTRMIAGEPHEKIIYGVVQMTPEIVQKIQDAGIDLKTLPSNLRR